jgi:hypothetical protein
VCFSPTADVVAGVVVGVAGVDALRHVRSRRELPLALLPATLAVHQFIEAFVWGEAGEDGAYARGGVATWLYLIIAFAVLPVLVPLAVTLADRARKPLRMAVFTGIGTVVAAVLLHATVRGPVYVAVEGHHLDYRVHLAHGGVVVALYVLVTCVPSLLSAYPHIRWFGMANLVAAAVLAWVDQGALISLWCLLAAVTSIAIAAHLRLANRVAVARPELSRSISGVP